MSDFDSHEIERSLERDRMQLAESLAALHDRLSPSALMSQGKEALVSQAAPLLSRVDHAVRAQPVVAAVAGVAVAALILGRLREKEEPHPAEKFEAITRWEDEGGLPMPEPADPEEEWLRQAKSLRLRARDMLRQIDHAARRSLAPAAELAKHRAEVMGALARDTKSALEHGLGDLTEAARAEALEARERVYMASVAAAAKGREVVENHPLASGLAMMGLGAAVAWMFPPTEAEDRLLGEARDSLMDEARATVKAEVTKASDLAQSLQSALGRDISRARMVLRPEHAWSGAGVRH